MNFLYQYLLEVPSASYSLTTLPTKHSSQLAHPTENIVYTNLWVMIYLKGLAGNCEKFVFGGICLPLLEHTRRYGET